MPVFFLVFACVMAIIYIAVELTQKPLVSLFIKALASLSFIMLGLSKLILGHQMMEEVFGWVILGLAAGMIGDIVLALRPLRPKEEDKTIIVMGIIAFSLGHIFYLLGLNTAEPFHWISFGFGLIAAILIFIASIMMKFNMGIAKYPSYFYAFLIFTMIGQSLILTGSYANNEAYILFMIGAILFGVSDLVLAPIYYAGSKSKLMVALNLTTYYGAQILIALSLFYF